jgi:hypothetical protein
MLSMTRRKSRYIRRRKRVKDGFGVEHIVIILKLSWPRR